MDRFRDDDAVQVFISTDAGGTGLNLQCRRADQPGHPVEPGRARPAHRAGPPARPETKGPGHPAGGPDSYEERVLGLVQGKRDLFDNVVTRTPPRTW
jgi:hypothetical protein